MAAGGPMAAPSVPCTLLTPIAPHSLSFRPLVVPESSEIEIYLPSNARAITRQFFFCPTSAAVTAKDSAFTGRSLAVNLKPVLKVELLLRADRQG